MISSINDKIRSKIQNESILQFIIGLDEIDIEKKEQILKLMLCDHYKISFLNYVYNNIRDDFSLFSNPIDNILMECEDNCEVLLSIVDSFLTFAKLDFIKKIYIMSELNKYGKDECLMNISPLYLLDKIVYQVVYEMDSFKEYYLDYITVNKEEPNKRHNASAFIADKINDIKSFDYNKYKRYILECIREYYKWKLFIKDKDGEKLLFREDYIYLNKIKNYSIEKLLKLAGEDYLFLTTIVGEYLHYTTSQLEISEEIVDKHLISNTNQELQKKLEIKKEFN